MDASSPVNRGPESLDVNGPERVGYRLFDPGTLGAIFTNSYCAGNGSAIQGLHMLEVTGLSWPDRSQLRPQRAKHLH